MILKEIYMHKIFSQTFEIIANCFNYFWYLRTMKIFSLDIIIDRSILDISLFRNINK